ncbi:hypothetical protein AVEN_82393-1 [Araneus ventricosus]|uniref:Uncharacterized protein n=1 Tax=Araneus ventricosus TaxID=182803 RepID=A0A4Y2SPT4_ARAVE|nr:hypothetical protein AVEN_82393-1 [Araneus ventricosus]
MDRKKCRFCGRFSPPKKEYYCFLEEEEDDGCFTTNLEGSENLVQKTMKPDCNPLDSSTVNFEYSNVAFRRLIVKNLEKSFRCEMKTKENVKDSCTGITALGSSSNISSILTKPGI